MRIEISCTKLEAAPDIKEYAKKRIAALSRLLLRFEEEKEVVVFVELARTTRHHRKGNVFYAEGSIDVPGKSMRATFTGPDIHVAIDKVEEKLKKELRRYKGKVLSQRKV
jgi:ribosomal subunit interface protein